MNLVDAARAARAGGHARHDARAPRRHARKSSAGWRAPRHHDVRAEDVDLKRLGAVLAAGLRARPARFRVAAARGERGPAHPAIAGAGRRGSARRAHPLSGSRTILLRAGRQGRASLPRAAQDLRRIDRACCGHRSTRPSWAAPKNWRAWRDSTALCEWWRNAAGPKRISRRWWITSAPSRAGWAGGACSTTGGRRGRVKMPADRCRFFEGGRQAKAPAPPSGKAP